MTVSILSGVARATALTRAGKLTEAVAQIQRSLSGTVAMATAAPAPTAAMPDPASDVIEGRFTVVDAPAKPRGPLAKTLRHIARGGMPDAAARTDAPGTQPCTQPGTPMTRHSHSGPEGARDYLLFVPQPRPPGPCAVVVLLHGCTQTPADFAAGTGMNVLAQAQGVIVVYPAQPAGANMNKCWNWFRPGDQARGAGEPAILAGITRAVLAAQPAADPGRVYVAGLSAGGAAAVILAEAYPEIFAAAGVHSGLPVGAARDAGQAFAAMRSGAAGVALAHPVPTIVFHGAADGTVAPGNGLAVIAQAEAGLAGAGMAGVRRVTRGRKPGGRSYARTALTAPDGRTLTEFWHLDGAGHAWSGGSAAGSYTDPTGPDASAEMLRFFAQHRLG